MTAANLAAKHCVPCKGGTPPLAGPELQRLHREVGTDWQVVKGHHLAKEYQFPDFAQALAFTNRVGAIAEAEGHHPNIFLTWGRVSLEIWTHSIDGLTESDFVLAAKADAAAR
jgi:4a-hydroxytetrahydrobiopterin dehydratase